MNLRGFFSYAFVSQHREEIDFFVATKIVYAKLVQYFRISVLLQTKWNQKRYAMRRRHGRVARTESNQIFLKMIIFISK